MNFERWMILIIVWDWWTGYKVMGKKNARPICWTGRLYVVPLDLVTQRR